MSVRVPPDRPDSPDYEEARSLGGPLAAQLARYDEKLRARVPDAGKAYADLVEHLKGVGAGSGGPAAGDALPPFLLSDENGRLTSSDELLATGPMIVSLNRGNWCPYCWLELSALQDCHTAIAEHGGSIVSITPEVATFSRRLKRRLGLAFHILTDIDNAYAMELGLAMVVTEEVRKVYETAGIDLGTFQRSETWFLPLPATFVVDHTGIIRHSYINADFRERFDPAEIPTLLSKL